MKSRHKRMIAIFVGLVGVVAVVALILNALQSNINHFFSPTEVVENKAPKDRTFRLGGLVEEGSIKREDDGLTVHFNVTDGAQIVTVKYTGILPDLFREGEGVVAQGKLGTNNLFMAEEVLAKHDETYMPPEVAEALERAEDAKAEEVRNSTNSAAPVSAPASTPAAQNGSN